MFYNMKSAFQEQKKALHQEMKQSGNHAMVINSDNSRVSYMELEICSYF